MEPTPGNNPDELRATAAAAVAPDPATADLLAKYAKGEPLTAQENGKLSWVGRKFPWLAEKFGVAPKPSQPAPPAGGPPAVGARPTAQAADPGVAAVEVDSGFAERTTKAILRRTDAIAQRVIGNAARDAGAPPEMVARFERAAAMSADDKALLAELSPACCEAAGFNPRHYPLATAGSIFGLYVTDLALLVMELRGMKAERNERNLTPTRPPASPLAPLAARDPRPVKPGPVEITD